MGWLDTKEDKRRQHLQMIATGNIKDIDRIHERDRSRRINLVLWILLIISCLIGFGLFNIGELNTSYYFFGFSIIIIIALIFRYGIHRKVKSRKKTDSWERLNRVPNWVHRKMKKKRTNKVNGDHYVYKREGKTYFRKLK